MGGRLFRDRVGCMAGNKDKFGVVSQGDQTANREFFVGWLALPPNRREPRTQEALAEALGVSSQTLRNWKRDPRIVGKVKGKIQGVLAVNDLSQIVESLKEQAFDSSNPRSVQASKVLIELMERGEQKQAEVPLSDKSNDELKELVAGLYDELDERADSA